MGFILSKIIEFFTKNRNNFKIIILGMQNAGKTTILYRLSLGTLVKTTPTIGSNVEELTYNNVKFQAWDLGGQESTRSVWDVYYMNTDAIVYVIDSQDDEYFEESKSQFHKLLKHPTLKNATILIFANKQDLTRAKNINKLIQDYEFDKIKSHVWHIQPCSALKGEGLITGIKWLSEQLVFKGKNNFPNNPYLINENDIKNEEKKENNDISLTVNNMKDSASSNYNLKKNDVVNDINNLEDKKEDENNIDNNNNNIINTSSNQNEN
jgi:small GTP-binding protein